ncbi:MAG: hypothetical protein M0Z56_05530, partial [Desulfobacteraceae bacterium]|nr:hypothetical protein [Desulfobacteraceae bacterium]
VKSHITREKDFEEEILEISSWNHCICIRHKNLMRFVVKFNQVEEMKIEENDFCFIGLGTRFYIGKSFSPDVREYINGKNGQAITTIQENGKNFSRTMIMTPITG